MSEPFTNDDFMLQEGKLRLARREPCAVVIMTKTDANSIKLTKILSSISGLTTGYLDISAGKNREVVNMSRETNTPITHLPYLAFFFDGKLKSRYKGDVTKDALTKYFSEKIFEAKSSNMVSKDEPSAPRFTMAQPNKQMPSGDPKTNGMVGLNVAWRSDVSLKK